MRHRKAGLKLNRTSSHRKAMFRNMATSFFKHESIRTTDAKAKGLRQLAERLITLAKRGDLHARRQALSIIQEKEVVHKLFEDIGGRFKNIEGGYTRIIKLGKRKGDAASISLIELVDESTRGKKKKKRAGASGKSSNDSAVQSVAQEKTPPVETAAKIAEEAPTEETAQETEAEVSAEKGEADSAPAESVGSETVDPETVAPKEDQPTT